MDHGRQTTAGDAPRLRAVDTERLYAYLMARRQPVGEAELLREIMACRSLPGARGELFILHFSLYHALYGLRERAGRDGYFLHLDHRCIMLARAAAPGTCQWYDARRGRCCGEPAGAAAWCAAHAAVCRGADALPFFDPLADFYTNPDNVGFGADDVLDRIMRGLLRYALRRGEVEKALALFGLHDPDRTTVRRRYRRLASQYHPDHHGGDESRMKELNHAYEVLREVFVV